MALDLVLPTEVRRGNIGVIWRFGHRAAADYRRIHQLGGGITHAGHGGRDLSEAVGGITARQALDMLTRYAEQPQAIVIVSKPPSAAVADHLLRSARATGSGRGQFYWLSAGG